MFQAIVIVAGIFIISLIAWIELFSHHFGLTGGWEAFFLLIATSGAIWVVSYIVGFIVGWVIKRFSSSQIQPSTSAQHTHRAQRSIGGYVVPGDAPIRPGLHRPPGWLGLKWKGLHFEFQILKTPCGEVRAYILSCPSYGSRSKDLHSTHRLEDDRGNPHICPGWMPENFEEAKAWAAVWCKYTENYIRTGKTT